ncbi:hypothetical protein EUX98_g4737 [Antrodiella citrinella]|uniref:Uncharacterized protein n=1 Tax=Antrodiella citrinella TaxID=2447956 RepID=A0A4S4MT89_9APHY|nr:hypothetical protein EUX98_g4737 [Antrodiella citrinella]
MISDGKQDLANDLHDLSFHTLKIDHTFTTFVCQLTSLRDGLERHGGLERFSGAVADVLLKLRGLHQLKDSAKNLPGLLFDMLSGGAEDGISTIIMTVAPPICLGALYSSIFFYRRWLIKKEGTRFGAVDEPEWQDGCTQLDERSSTSWNAWKGILNEMQSLRTLLAIQAEEGPIAPLSHVNTRLHEKASMYADVNVSLRQYQVSVI